MGKNRIRNLGIAVAFATGPAIFYLGSNLISRDSGRRDAESAVESKRVTAQAWNGGESKEHEAKVLAEALKKKPGHAPVLLRLAQMSEESGNPSEAAGHLREVLQQEPHSTDALLELGRVLFEAGDVRSAIEQTRKILDREPDHPDALYNLGAIYANLGNAKFARNYWNRLIRTSPQSASAERARRMLDQLPPESL